MHRVRYHSSSLEPSMLSSATLASQPSSVGMGGKSGATKKVSVVLNLL